MTTLANLTSRTVRKKTSRRRPNGRQCFFEPLEDRRLLAVIASDGFETANLQGGAGDWIGNWQTSGSPFVTSSSSPQSGSYHALVQGSEDIQRSVDVSGLTDLQLSFGAKLRSFESSDLAQVEARIDGGSWTTLKQFVNGEDDNQYRTYGFAVPGEGDTLEVRFNGLMSSSRKDYWYIDNLQVTGTPAGPPEISISDATATEGDIGNVGSASVFVSAGSGGLDRPRGITFGPDGNFYVTSVETDSVLRYDGETGTFLDEFVSSGSGGLDAPRDILFDPNGQLLVASGKNDRILRYNGADGSFDTVLVDGTGGLDNPQNLAYVDAKDELWVSSGRSDEILKYGGMSGAFLGAVVAAGSGGLSNPKWHLFTESGDLLVVSQLEDEILKYGASGDFQGVFYTPPGDSGATTILMGMTWGPDGNLLVAEDDDLNAGRVIRLDANTGAFIDEYVPTGFGGLSSPRSMITDAENNLYVVSYETDEVLRYAPGANAAFTVSLSSPSDLPVSVDFDTADLSATAESDYASVSGKLTFDPGVTTRTIIVPTIDDTELEPTEDFTVTLSNAVGGVISATQGVGLGEIIDNEVPNAPPIVDAGADQTLNDDDGSDDEAVTLTGSAVDTDGSIVSVSWSDESGVLTTDEILNTTLPVGTHTLTFSATDNDGATSTDLVLVTVVANQAPTANAGDDQTVVDENGNGSEVVTLDGTASADGDGAIVSYQWTEGSTTLGSQASISAELGLGAHVITLTVTDNGGKSSSDTVTVVVNEVASGPNLTFGNTMSNGGWNTVTLPRSYTSMVVVASPNYDKNDVPAIVRIRNASGNSFEFAVQEATNSASPTFVSGVRIHYTVMEEGVYDNQVDGYRLEAVTFNSTVTDENNSWIGESRTYQQSYTNPVVVGQVMSFNDPDWSVFWAAGGGRTAAPTPSALTVGKHVGEDADTTRSNETIGYFVIEATTTAVIDGYPIAAGVSSDFVRGTENVANATGYQIDYGVSFNSKAAVVSNAGMDGGDGGWAVLYGNDPIDPFSSLINVAIDEDQIANSERRHTTEQVAYFVVDPPLTEAVETPAATNRAFAPLLVDLDLMMARGTDKPDAGQRIPLKQVVAPTTEFVGVARTDRADLPSAASQRASTKLRALDEFFSNCDEQEETVDEELLDQLL